MTKAEIRPISSLAITLAFLTTIGLCSLSLLQASDGEVSSLVSFAGRFHLVLLHAPIGLLLGLVVVELVGLLHRSADVRVAATALLWVTALASVVTAVLGTLLALSGGYDEALLFRHRWLGVGVAVLLVWTLLVRRRPVLYGFCLAGALVLMSCAGHFGGSLTHGSDYIFRFMPNGLRNFIGLPPREAAVVDSVYSAQIQPIFDQYCTKCHGESKQKGDLRLDRFQALMTSEVVIPGDPAGSLLVQMMRLPLDDLDRMPPEDKPQPSEADISAIEAWIAAGATAPDQNI